MDEQITKRSRRFSFSLFRPRRSQEQECVEQLPTQPLELEGGPKSLAKRDLRRGSFSASALTTPKSNGSCITSKAEESFDSSKNFGSTGSAPAPSSNPQSNSFSSPRRRSTGERVQRSKRATVAFESAALSAHLQAMEHQHVLETGHDTVLNRPRSGSTSSTLGRSGKTPTRARRQSVAETSYTPLVAMKRSNSFTDIRKQIRQELEEKHVSMELDLKKAEEERQQRDKRPLRVSKGVPEHVRKRNLVINEIISTEQDYITDLEVMTAVFRSPMLEEIATKEEVHVLFSNVQQLVEVSKMLLTDMVQRVKETNGDELGDSFLLFGDYLKMYATYCSNQAASREMLDRCNKENKLFKAFLNRAQLDPRVNNLLLRDYLIKPVQRICKYPLLLRELLKNTDSGHPDYEKLTSALAKIQNVVASVNEKKQHEEEFAAIARVLAQLNTTSDKFSIQLMVPGRKYLQEGTLLEASKDRGEFYPRHYFLFSDLLILTNGQPNQKGGSAAGSSTPNPSKKPTAKLDVVSVIPVNQTSMNFNQSEKEDTANTIEIDSAEAIYILPFISLELKRKWAQRRAADAREERVRALQAVPVLSPQCQSPGRKFSGC